MPTFAISRRLRTIALAPLAIIALAACKQDDWACLAFPQRGIEFAVLDATTRANLESLAVVVVTPLSPRGSPLSGPPSEAVRIATTAGSYSLFTSATGYRSRTDTVAVGSRMVHGCEQVTTVVKVVELSRQP